MADDSPDAPDVAARVLTALRLLALDPGLGGLRLRARAGPLREALLRGLAEPPLARLHPATLETALAGGLDLAATLAAGRPVMADGPLGRPGLVVLAMAERTPPALAGRLGALLDGGRHGLLALDEAADPDEGLPPALAERLAFGASLDGCREFAALPPVDLAEARARLRSVRLPDDAAGCIAGIAADLGIGSARAPLFTLRAARGLAALAGRDEASADDLAEAAALTLAHRATRLPEAAEPPAPASQEQRDAEPGREAEIPDELVLAAVMAALPAGLLAAGNKAQRSAAGSGAGARRAGNRRGRPLPSRPGRPSTDARIDLVASLRAAAPWQRLRASQATRPGPQIRGADLRLRRHEARSDRLVVFAVDASGSTALARLGEAKGAVELLLGQVYSRRDHVALVAFRGTAAELVLPPTRSLVQAKRRLAALPGGGGTPLAAGLKAALEVAEAARRRGFAPLVALLTDGRGNVALDGTAGRAQAAADARRVAGLAAAQGVDALVIDTGQRPDPGLAELARTLRGRYLALPRARAEALKDALGAATTG